MSEIERLRTEIAELSRVLQPLAEAQFEEWSPEWMNRQSLLVRENQLRMELQLYEGRYELEVQLIGERVQRSAVEALFVGKLIESLQSAVSAVSEALMLGRPPGAARSRYSSEVLTESTMRLVGTAAGSFVLGFEGPRSRGIQLSFAESVDEDPLPIFDEAIGKVLDVADAADHDIDGSVLIPAIASLGSHRAVRRISDLARLLAVNATQVSIVDRSPFAEAPRTCNFTVPGARRLQQTLERTAQTTETIVVRGRLTGVRWRSGIFDLETESGSEVITGRIAVELREAVRSAFDRDVRVTVDRIRTTSEIDSAEDISYRLIDLEPV